MEKIKCKIIVCGPAIGKTYLAQHDDRFVDLDNERAKYKYGLFDATIEELESGKMNRGKAVNHDTSNYIINKIKESLESNKCVLLSYHEKILDYVIKNNIDYCLVYTSPDMHNEILKRMKNRGNVDAFIDLYKDEQDWIKFYQKNLDNTTAKYKIELKAGQYLSDIAGMFF